MTWVVAGKVTTLQGDPIGGATVVLAPISGAQIRSLTTDLQGEFKTDYILNARAPGKLGINLTVSKKGFLNARATVDLGDISKPWIIHVTLRDAEPDPALLSQGDLISGLAPGLRKAGASEGLSAKGEKDYAQGAEEFLDKKRPDRSLSSFAKVVRRDPSCLLCRTMWALAELDAGDWDGAYRDLSEAVVQGRANTKVARPEPLVALGIMESWRHQPERAWGFLSEAVGVGPANLLALQELGRAELLRQNFEIAATHLTKAIEAGAGPEARLLRSEALEGEDDLNGASKEMDLYLAGRDVRTMPQQVRVLWLRIRDRSRAEGTQAKARSRGGQPIDYLHQTTPELQGLEPATDQKLLEPILAAVGKNVAEFFRNFPNTSSLEKIHQEKLGRNENVQETLNSKAQYLCLLHDGQWGPWFEEYRTGPANALDEGRGLAHGFMLTSGFASASLLFHPSHQPQTIFRYLGQQKIHSRNTYVIAFAQQPAKARMKGAFRTSTTYAPTFSQGLAWIDPETYQILRLRTDLLLPVPEVRLDRETTQIDFGEVRFNQLPEAFWLPQEVTVTVAWAGKRLRNKHLYSDFKLFNVESTQKLGKPETPPPISQPLPAPKPSQ